MKGAVVRLDRRTALGWFASLAAFPVRAQSLRLPVVATFSILADFARNVGGDRVEVAALVGPNGDAHVYQPAPGDARTVAAAQALVVNGLGLEGWLDRLLQASGSKARRIVASTGVAPLGGVGEAAGKPDPHAWQSVANAKLYVANIRDGLVDADPDGAAVYGGQAAAYLSRLDALESEVVAAIAAIPARRRILVTTHDAFGYFGQAYGVTFLAPEGVSTESEASAKDVAAIIRQVRRDHVPAVFLENIADPRMMQRIAKETGAKIGATLYSDALSAPDGPAATYIDMMRSNVRALVAGLA